MHKSQGRRNVLIYAESAVVDPAGNDLAAEPFAKSVISDLPDKSCLFPEFLQHRQHIAGRTARIRFKYRIPGSRFSGIDHIDQKFA